MTRFRCRPACISRCGVTIGEGAGRNWWCVIFPPSASRPQRTASSTPAAAGGFSDAEIGLMTRANGAYTVKFRSLELLQALKNTCLGISAIKSAAGRDAAEPAIWQSCLRMNKYKKSGAVSKEHFDTKI
ncbi:MAG: stage II sporulation protein R [Acutalibacteraceae bacterium]